MTEVQRRIGVVTVTYNSAKVLPDFFESTNRQIGCEFHLYVIDNASRDESVALSRTLAHCATTIIANPDNVGVAEGNNQGIRKALEDGCTHVLLL
ncbi:MAG: glycosyltransferase, partial [Hyphomicrobiales bacterium]